MSSEFTTRKQHMRTTSSGRTQVSRHPMKKRKRKIIDAQMVDSINKLASNKEGREYSVSIDLDDMGNSQVYVESFDDVHRGKTGSESKNGRANVALKPGSDVTIHTHPSHNNVGTDKWNRPSGTDIGLMIRETQIGMDEAFVVGPDRQWYRYRMALDIKDWELGFLRGKANQRGGIRRIDTEIEKEYGSIYRDESKYYHLNARERQRGIDGKLSDADWKRLDRRKNSFSNRKRSLTIARRSFKRFQDYLGTKWRVELVKVARIPMGSQKGGIDLTYIPDR